MLALPALDAVICCMPPFKRRQLRISERIPRIEEPASVQQDKNKSFEKSW